MSVLDHLKVFFGVLLLVLCTSPVGAQNNSQVQWITFEQLEDSLTSNPKKIFISFYTEWCTYCRKMEKEVFTKPTVIQVLNQHYYAVKMDAESKDTVSFEGQLFINRNTTKRRKGMHDLAILLARRNGQFAPPTMLILNPEFVVEQRYFEYMHSAQLLKALQ